MNLMYLAKVNKTFLQDCQTAGLPARFCLADIEALVKPEHPCSFEIRMLRMLNIHAELCENIRQYYKSLVDDGYLLHPRHVERESLPLTFKSGLKTGSGSKDYFVILREVLGGIESDH